MKESNNKERRLSFGEKVSYGFGVLEPSEINH